MTKRKAKPLTDRQEEQRFQAQVIKEARERGWFAFHCFDSRFATGSGFPDLVLTKGGRIAFWELKSQKGIIRPEQEGWMTELDKHGGVDVKFLRPADWDYIRGYLNA